MKYSQNDIGKLSAAIQSAAASDSAPAHISKQQAVMALSKGLLGLRRQGYSLVQIAEILRGEGLDILPITLKTYLQRAKKATVGHTPRSQAPKPPPKVKTPPTLKPLGGFRLKDDITDL